MDQAPGRPVNWQDAVLKLLASPFVHVTIIALVALMFARPILNFDESHIPAGEDDWQDLTASMQLARDSIMDHHEMPLWDPYFATGTPYLAEPKTYVLNPVATVPVLVFGVYNGPKVSAMLSMALAGVGLYVFAALLGCSRPWRLWAGLLMAMSGAIAARVYAGHFQFILALGFFPWAFALSLLALRTKGIVYPMLAALANAGVFLSGHVVPTVFAVPGLLIVYAFVAIDESRLAPPGRREDTFFNVTGRGIQIAGWTFGLVAVQLLPLLESLSYFSRPSYSLAGAQSIAGSAHNFFTSNVHNVGPGVDRSPWGWWEYYTYVGIVPLLSFIVLPFALLLRRPRVDLLLVTTLFGFYLFWAAAPHTPLRWMYDVAPHMHQLRVPSRALMFTAPFLILLSACSLDWLSRWLRDRTWTFTAQRTVLRIGPIVSVILIATSFFGLRDVYSANRSIIGGRTRFPDDRVAARALRAEDQDVFSVEATNLGQAVPPEFYKLGIKRIDAAWEYRYFAPRPPGDTGPPIPVTARYIIGEPDPPVPFPLEQIFITGRYPVYEQVDAPPYASTLNSKDAPEEPAYDWTSKAAAAEARIVSANVVEVRATPRAGQDRLLVLETFHPGWRVEIDGKRVGRAGNFGGFLSMPALTGEHTYVFVYDPRSVRFGAAFTIGTLLGAALLLAWRAVERAREQPLA